MDKVEEAGIAHMAHTKKGQRLVSVDAETKKHLSVVSNRLHGIWINGSLGGMTSSTATWH